MLVYQRVAVSNDVRTTSPMGDGKAQAHWTDEIDRFNLTGLA